MNILGIAGGYRGLINGDIRPLHPGDFWGILTRGGTILGTSREKPFKSNEIGEDKVKEIKDNYRKHKLDALVVLGGNGTSTSW
jgi:6-phosphofructokinase 1